MQVAFTKCINIFYCKPTVESAIGWLGSQLFGEVLSFFEMKYVSCDGREIRDSWRTEILKQGMF
jgi:hypothetical protein